MAHRSMLTPCRTSRSIQHSHTHFPVHFSQTAHRWCINMRSCEFVCVECAQQRACAISINIYINKNPIGTDSVLFYWRQRAATLFVFIGWWRLWKKSICEHARSVVWTLRRLNVERLMRAACGCVACGRQAPECKRLHRSHAKDQFIIVLPDFGWILWALCECRTVFA